MALSPDQFNSRWVDRMKGKRKTMGETRKDGSNAKGEER